MSKILIVDDDSSLRRAVSMLLTKHGCDVTDVASGQEAVRLLPGSEFDIVITDLKMDDMSGLELLRLVKANYPEIEVILMTAYGSISNAVEVMRAEAFDYITKPFKNEDLLHIIDKALERRRLVAEVKYLREVVDYKYNFGTIIGESRAIRKVIDLVEKYSGQPGPILMSGAPGTGKELTAKAIHDNSNRHKSKFMTINCSAVPGHILKTELFGASAQAKNGRLERVSGALEKAAGGTILLEDIADLDPSNQQLLYTYLKMSLSGEQSEVAAKDKFAAIIAATVHDLTDKVDKGEFDRGLYELLNQMPVALPALRERGEDVLLLAEHFMKKYAREFGKQPPVLTSDAARMLLNHTWHGNVRELEKTIRRSVALCKNDSLGSEDLIMVSDLREGPHRLIFKQRPGSKQSLEEKELEYIVKSLRENNWNYTQTARQLGIGRTTLWRKMKKIKEYEREKSEVTA